MKWLTLMTTYLLIILAELGDKTQVATLLLASNNPSKRWVIFGAGALALSACVVIEVTVGATVARILSQATINKVTGYVFLVIGLVTLYREYARSKKWRLRFGIIPTFSNKTGETF
ncbi:MAG: TMEM165/GDT1 family protein [Eubacteriales bacterium]